MFYYIMFCSVDNLWTAEMKFNVHKSVVPRTVAKFHLQC